MPYLPPPCPSHPPSLRVLHPSTVTRNRSITLVELPAECKSFWTHREQFPGTLAEKDIVINRSDDDWRNHVAYSRVSGTCYMTARSTVGCDTKNRELKKKRAFGVCWVCFEHLADRGGGEEVL